MSTGARRARLEEEGGAKVPAATVVPVTLPVFDRREETAVRVSCHLW